MSRRQRFVVVVLVLLGILAAVLLLAAAANTCPAELHGQPCPGAARNRALVVGLASAASGLLVAPFAFLAEFVARRRIVYRRAWERAARRGVLAGALVAVLGGLRLGDALTVPVALFVLMLAGMVEWLAARR